MYTREISTGCWQGFPILIIDLGYTLGSVAAGAIGGSIVVIRTQFLAAGISTSGCVLGVRERGGGLVDITCIDVKVLYTYHRVTMINY